MAQPWRPSASESRLLLKLGRDVTSTLDLQRVLDASFAALRQLVRFDGGAIALRDDGALMLAATDPPATPEALGMRLPLGEGATGTIALTGEPIYIPDIEADPRVHRAGKSRATSPGVRSWFGVPLMIHGEPNGVLSIDSVRPDAFDDDLRTLVLAFAPTVAAAVQNAQLYERELRVVSELRETEQLKTDFLAVVSHELRTPLTTITGLADTLALRSEHLDRALVVELSKRIGDAADRLKRMIEDLLSISRLERGGFSIHPAPTSLWPIVRQAVVDSGTQSHVVTINFAPELPPVLADGDRLYQVVSNLLVNARKFSPPGSVIDIEARMEAGRVALSVRDQGTGIAPGEMERIFDRFYQIEHATTRSAGGLGIGLSLVKELTESMGGEVRVASKPGIGSTFTIVLPPAVLALGPVPAASHA